MKQLFAVAICLILSVGTLAADRRNASGATAEVLPGLDVLERDNFAALKDKNIAIVTNHSGRDREGTHIIQLLTKAEGVKVVCLFSPEHGLYGEVDEKVGDAIDPKSGLQVYSLYGKTRKPTPEMLKGVDTLVFDIQDVGARFYTYSATLGICMEAAKENKLAIFVLDRPNPITGLMVEGPVADDEYLGKFTSFGPIPVAHGMTFGELAKYYNEELKIGCDLHVVEMKNWTRDMWFDETGLLWLNPSPNMRNLNQATLYPGVCLIEATNVSVGRGCDQPFEMFGAPWMDGRKLADALNSAKQPGVRFYPIEFTPMSSKFTGEKCSGVYVLVTDRNKIEAVKLGTTIAWTIEHLFGEKFEYAKVVRLLQDGATQKAIETASAPEEIPNTWHDELEAFKKIRAKYLIYK